jgi:diguanylate cyclase (GGDEF)-like protein
MQEFILFNYGVDSFALVVMLIILFTCFTSFDNTQDVRFMRVTFILLTSTLFFDLVQWAIEGNPGSTTHAFMYLDVSLYYISQILSVIAWGDYVYYRVSNKIRNRKIGYILDLTPFVIILLLVFINLFTGCVFTVGPDNRYERGPLSNPIAFLVMGYLLCTRIWVLYKRMNEKLASARREYLLLAGFVIAPFIGAIIQIQFYGISLIWPLCSISMLLLYINRSRDEISIDALTGLNNRGSLDKFMLERIHDESDERLTLLLMDVDKFKLINDNLGHDMGDVALREVSEIIRQTFSSGNNFISRYGGDEFVVIIPQVDDPRMIDGFMNDLRNNVDAFNKSQTFPMPLSISCGMAFYPKDGIHSPEDLLKAADAQMYEEKEKHHHKMGYK